MGSSPVRSSARQGEHGRSGRTHRWSSHALGVLTAGAVFTSLLVWLLSLTWPLTSDESGFTLVAQQWNPGSSLYGDYWVDRPPLLMWLFAVAGDIDPAAWTVRLLGAVASGASILLVGLLGALTAPGYRWGRGAAVVLTTALLCSPLFGMPGTTGELLALPFVLAGLSCLLASMRTGRPGAAALLAAGAGAAAMCAALVKQSAVDVFVFAAVALVVVRGRGVWARTAAFLAGSVAALGVVGLSAAARGTTPAGLWEAVVVFRLRAAAVIGASASEATTLRMWLLAAALVGSGAVVVLTVTLVPLIRRRRGVRRTPPPHPAGPLEDRLFWPVLALLGWEVLVVAFGGSYWLHYLTGLVPGMVMVLLLARLGPREHRWLVVGLTWVTLASLVGCGVRALVPMRDPSDARVTSYLREHAGRADGMVVAFGHPEMVADSRLTSPYPLLWSLQVRVRDPELRALGSVMTGPRAPRWIVVNGAGIYSWGLDATRVQRDLERRYVDVATYGGWHIWRRTGRVR